MRHYFVKHGAPVWIHVPGTPFTLPGIPARFYRIGLTKEAQDKRGFKLEFPSGKIAQNAATPGLLAQLEERQDESNNVSRGLLASPMLPQPNPPGLLSGPQVPSVLKQFPHQSATESTPLVTTSNTGV
jgi:hypothetical protein